MNIFDCSLSCSFISLSNSPCLSLKTSIVDYLFYFNLQEKGMGFLILSSYFMFIAFIFLNFKLVWRFEICDDSDMGWVIFVTFDCMDFVGFDNMMLNMLVLMFDFHS